MLKFTMGVVVGATLMASGAAAYVVARVDTNGVLQGYIVQRGSETICSDPIVWNQFRGPESYIVCE